MNIIWIDYMVCHWLHLDLPNTLYYFIFVFCPSSWFVINQITTTFWFVFHICAFMQFDHVIVYIKRSRCCDDACDKALIEKNGVTPKWVTTPF